MQHPNTDHKKEMLRVIKWVLETPLIGLKIKPEIVQDINGKVVWTLRGICDATWGSDPDDGRSVTGYILFFMGFPIVWKSKTQNSVVLSSAEAEYVSSTELVKDMLWVKQILEFMQIQIELPMKVYIDNISAIHMVRNNLSNTGTRHMNIRLHFVREIHGTIVDYQYVRTENNISDILTKNATRQEHEKHAPKLVGEVPEILWKNINQEDDDE